VSADGTKVAGFARGSFDDPARVCGNPFGCFTNSILDITPPCDGDWDLDDRLTFFGIHAYLTDYNTADPAADLDRDGAVETRDLFRFIDAFVAGCP